jgi:multiple sugar transport system permease protein
MTVSDTPAPQPPSRWPHWLTRERRRLAWRFLLALVVLVFFLFPVYWLFITSIKSAGDIFARPPVWFPEQPTFRIFGVLFKDGDVWAIYNSLIIATVSTVVAMVIGTAAAYSIARFKTGGQNLAIWIISQRMIPPIVIVFPVFLLFVWLGWIDSYIGLILLYIAFNLPYVIWMMRGYIEDVPVAVEESALVDGCTRWQVLYKIIVPMSRAGIFATAVFTFLFTWNEFVFALVLTNNHIVTYPVQVTGYFAAQQTYWNSVGAMSILGTIPVFFAVIFFQRYLVRGISMGAIKG